MQPQVQPGVLIAPQQPAIAQPAVQPAVLSPQPGVAAAPINPPRRLRFQLGARGLEDLDVIGTTDPYIKLYYTDDLKSADTAIGRTAPLTDTENPDFTEIFDFDYVPGKRQVGFGIHSNIFQRTLLFTVVFNVIFGSIHRDGISSFLMMTATAGTMKLERPLLMWMNMLARERTLLSTWTKRGNLLLSALKSLAN